MSCLAHLGAIQQQPYMWAIGVPAALFETVVNRVSAGVVTILTLVDAVMHLWRVMGVDVLHTLAG